MAEGLNRVLLLGNLGADPELRNTSGGQVVLKMRLATATTFRGNDGTRRERTEWHSVIVWGRRAEALAKILTKGTRLFVEGEIRSSSYETSAGEKRHKTEIVASNILFAGAARSSSSPSRNYDDHDEPPPQEYARGDDEQDDDIPF